jgi:glycosyltransferase involved in cell wall biosynthesis
MRALVISFIPPTLQNGGAISTYVYQTLAERPASVDVALLTFEHELNDPALQTELRLDSYRVLNKNGGITRNLISNFIKLRRLPTAMKYFYPSPQNRKIIRDLVRDFQPQVVWLYAAWLVDFADLFPGIPVVTSGMDCVSLVWNRMLRRSLLPDKTGRREKEFREAVQLDRVMAAKSRLVHFLGKPDERVFRRAIAPNCFYTLFPQGRVVDSNPERFHQSPIRLLVSGSGGNFHSDYMAGELQECIRSVARDCRQLAGRLKVQFAGSDAGDMIDCLRENGIEAEEIKRTHDGENYLQALQQATLLISPLRLGGGGIKTRVLQAMGSGVPVIGSRYSFENIPGQNGEHFFRYRHPSETGDLVNKAVSDPNRLQAMAERAAQAVAQQNNPVVCSRAFWDKLESLL